VEFRTAREAALYQMLKQVLRNYIVTQRIAYLQTLGAWVPVLGFQLGMMVDTRDEIPSLLARTIAALHEEQRTRTDQPLPSFADYGVTSDETPAQELGTALVTLLRDSGIEHHLAVAATWRVCVALFADVLAMPRLDDAPQAWDIDGYIDSLHEHLPAQIDSWFARLTQGEASGKEDAP
jgi:hypothetical protein